MVLSLHNSVRSIGIKYSDLPDFIFYGWMIISLEKRAQETNSRSL